MKSSILIIGSDSKWEEEELLKAGKVLEVKTKILEVHEIDIRLNKKEAELFYRNKNITHLFKKSRLIFRRTRGAQEKMITLALLAKQWKIPFTDSVMSVMSNLNKRIFMASIVAGKSIHHIPTYFSGRGEVFDIDHFPFPLPVLVQPVYGRHGEDIKIIKSKSSLKRVLEGNNKVMMIQAVLDIESEYRVFVMGGKALGVVKKIPAEGTKIANYAAGAQFLKTNLPANVIRESIMICKDQGIHIGGVDLAKVGNEYYLLEVNRCPEFQAFSRATKIDVAKKIIHFLLKQ